MDPEPLGRLFRVEPWRLARRQAAQEEPRAEADRARRRRDEVRQVAERTQVAAPARLGEQRAEVRAARDERLPRGVGPRGDPRLARRDDAPGAVAGEQHTALLQELAHGRHPEGQRRRPIASRKGLRRARRVEPPAPIEHGRRRVARIDLAAGKRVEAAEELHAPLAADHVDLDRLGRARRRGAHDDHGRGRPGLGGHGCGVGHHLLILDRG